MSGRGHGRGRGRGRGRRSGRGHGRGFGRGQQSHLPKHYDPKHNLRNLILSCEYGNVSDLRELLNERGCSPNMFGTRQPSRVSPNDKLGFFVFRHHRRIKKNACPRIIISTDRTPLHICINKGYEVCAKLLVQAGANLDEPGKNGLSATRYVMSRRKEWLKWWPEGHRRAKKKESRALDSEAETQGIKVNCDNFDILDDEYAHGHGNELSDDELYDSHRDEHGEEHAHGHGNELPYDELYDSDGDEYDEEHAHGYGNELPDNQLYDSDGDEQSNYGNKTTSSELSVM